MTKALNDILSVSEFNGLIKDILKNLGSFRIKGEITEITITQRKGVYITISDGKSNLKLSGYAPTIHGIDIIEKGMDVIAEGTADLYVPYGSFSVNIFSISPVGEGSLAIAYQKLKENLEKDGLFDIAHKQELPLFITNIALLTGKDSAAYSDFIKILEENHTGIHISYYPVIVQGERAVESIQSALKDASTKNLDAIILTRGGGSLEDLKSFNDKDLAQTIFSSPIPIIAGVGHENDESIADFVADIRASTPSQAAYYISKQNQDFLEMVQLLGDKAYEGLYEILSNQEYLLDAHKSSIESSIQFSLSSFENKIVSIERILSSYNAEKTLKRGYAIVQKGKKTLDSIKDITVNDDIKVVIHDGDFQANVTDINSK